MATEAACRLQQPQQLPPHPQPHSRPHQSRPGSSTAVQDACELVAHQSRFEAVSIEKMTISYSELREEMHRGMSEMRGKIDRLNEALFKIMGGERTGSAF